MLAKRTPTQSNMLADKLLMIAEAEECRDSLKLFVKNAWSNVDPSPFVDGWCIDAICDHLTALTTGQIRFLLINIPPRHTKSLICSVLWPVWSWLQTPEDKFLCASYSLNLAIRDNLKKRNLIESRWFQERYGQNFNLATEAQAIQFMRKKEFSLSPHQKAKRFFLNDKLGYQLATSVGASTTGDGGSVLSIDDCHSASESHGDTERENALTWFKEVWSNRMNDASKDRMVTTGQRIHERDVSGLILKERPDWIHLNLPAEYEPSRHCFTSIGWSDPRKDAGELLWHERFSKETLDRYKRDLGSAGYAAQYQQTPVPSGGGMFKQEWTRRYSILDDHYELELEAGPKRIPKSACMIKITGDLAISEKQEADFTVFSTWAITPDKDILLLEVTRGHFDNPDQQKLIQLLHSRWHPAYFLIEAVAYQLALIQQIRKKGIPVREFKPVKDKVARATTASIMYEGGKIYHPHTGMTTWLADCEHEMLLFPKAAHDDFVDTTSMICEDVGKPRNAGGMAVHKPTKEELYKEELYEEEDELW